MIPIRPPPIMMGAEMERKPEMLRHMVEKRREKITDDEHQRHGGEGHEHGHHVKSTCTLSIVGVPHLSHRLTAFRAGFG